jgi:hypothetical protein
MPITRTPMVDDDGSGTTGTILNNAWKTEFYNQIDGVVQGAWVNVPFAAGNFSATSPMTWPVIAANQVTYMYLKTGDSVVFVFNIQNSTIGGTAALDLMLALPAGMIAAKQVAGTIRTRSNGVGAVGYSIIVAGENLLRCRSVAHTPWAVSSGNNDVLGQIVIPLMSAAVLESGITPLIAPDDPGLILPA